MSVSSVSEVSGERRQTFFHVHVRKCGGSTFHTTILARNFGAGYYRDAALIDDRYGAAQVEEILGNCPWLRAYSSHKISLNLPYESPRSEIQAIAFVRDPVARFVSHYFYLRHHALDWDRTAREDSLDRYIERAIEGNWFREQRQHSELRQLTEAMGDEGLAKVERYLATGCVWLFPVERFDEACVVLERRFPRAFRDTSYAKRANRSQVDQSLSKVAEAKLRGAIDQAEFQLMDLAQRQLDEALRRYVGDASQQAEALREHRQRCERRAKWWWPFPSTRR